MKDNYLKKLSLMIISIVLILNVTVEFNDIQAEAFINERSEVQEREQEDDKIIELPPAETDQSLDLVEDNLAEDDLSLLSNEAAEVQIAAEELAALEVMIELKDFGFVIKTVGASRLKGVEKVLFPTWTERNGQDDLNWYQGVRGRDGEYSFDVEIKNHGFESGLYNIHAYFYASKEKLLKVELKQTKPIISEIEIKASEIKSDSYHIQISNLANPNGVSSVYVPTWSDCGGQNDIRWEEANYIGDATWQAVIHLKDYSKSYDTYISHVYVKDLNGNNRFAGEIRKEVQNPFKEDPISLKFEMNTDNGEFSIYSDDFNGKSGIDRVSFAVWSNRNGQDDIRWYPGQLNGNGEYGALVSIDKHGFESGDYTIHTYVYGRQDEQIAMSGNSLKMEKGKAIIEYDQAVLNNTYKIRIKNVSSDKGVKSIYFATWSRRNGQDDIHWESASYIGNKTWEARINLRDYSHIVDDFISHAYLVNQNNEMEFSQNAVKNITHDTATIYGFFAYPLDKSYRANPNDPTDWFGPRWGRIHEGIDVPAPYYARCYSACNGVVERAGFFMGYGRYVRIRTTDRYGESVSFFYGHLREIHVSEGQPVSMGQVIGSVGGSGYNSQKIYIENAYGPHLHFGAIANADDACVDPEIWIDFHNPYRNQ